MTDTLAGLYPPIIIPFDEEGALALDQLEANMARWLAQPLDGVLVPGSNSEAVHLSQEELLAVWRLCGPLLRAAGKRFIAGVRGDSTAEAISAVQLAGEAGADAALMLPPYFYKGAMTHPVLTAHFRAVADASPLPILLYNVPAFTGVDFPLETLLALAEHPQIVGMKDSSINVVKSASVLANRPGFQVFAGTGGALLPFLSLGAAGGIMALANFAAVPLRRLYDAFHAGRWEEARQIQLQLVDINSAVTARFGIPGLKYAMDQTGFYGGSPRRPLLPASTEARQTIDTLLAPLELT